jgi:hypothetical protein
MALPKPRATKQNPNSKAVKTLDPAVTEDLITASTGGQETEIGQKAGGGGAGDRPPGVKFLERDSGSSRAVPTNTVNVQIVSTIIDRLAGTVVTEPIFRAKPNLNMIMRRASDPGVREKCATFFLTHKLVDPLTSVIPVNTLKPGDAAILQKDLFKAITKVENDPKVQMVVTEIVNAHLIGCGVIQDSGTFTTRIYYPFKPVTTQSLADDIGMQEVVRVLGGIEKIDISSKKYTNRSFAAAVAQSLYAVGKALLDVNELSGVVGDMVLGCRAAIDPELTGFKGSVTQAWRDNVVIQELSKNYVFVDAALSLPAGNATPLNDGWKLNNWAPIILAALKTSPRYAIVGKSEVTRSLGLRKIRDLRGRPVAYVLHRSAKPEAVAQSVYAFEDAEISGAVTVIPTKERVAEAVAAAYGQTSGLGTDAVAGYLVSFLTDAVEAGYTNYKLGYHIDLGTLQEAGHHEIACLLSERIRVKIEADGSVVKPGLNPDMTRDYGWWYHVATSERDFGDLNRGVFDSTTYVTNRLAEVFIAVDEFEPQSPVDPRPQLIAPVAFDSRIMGFDPATNLASLTSRYAWDITINNSRVNGAFKASELGGMKSLSNTSLVVPIYNDDVFHTVIGVFNTISSLLNDLVKQRAANGEGPDAVTISYLKRALGRSFLRYAQSLAPGFRQEIHNGMIDRAVTKLLPDAAMALRARLGQREFGGYADVSALLMFLTMQGFDTKAWAEMAKDLDMARVFLEYGSDRSSSSNI